MTENTETVAEKVSAPTPAPFTPEIMPAEIAAAIIAIMKNVKVIEKAGENTYHNYTYATNADLLDKLHDQMANQELLITQHFIGVEQDAGDNQVCKFRFILHCKGKQYVYPGTWLGVAQDHTKNGLADKWFNKALTSAEKYFLLKLFKIVTRDEEDLQRLNDGDADRDESDAPPDARAAAKSGPGRTAQPRGSNDKEMRDLGDKIKAEIDGAKDLGALDEIENFHRDNLKNIQAHSKSAGEFLVKRIKDKRAALSQKAD